jgi:hypothetical protein
VGQYVSYMNIVLKFIKLHLQIKCTIERDLHTVYENYNSQVSAYNYTRVCNWEDQYDNFIA